MESNNKGLLGSPKCKSLLDLSRIELWHRCNSSPYALANYVVGFVLISFLLQLLAADLIKRRHSLAPLSQNNLQIF
uniref:Uncharacterized protein n=1 Tax=Lepeophtheirus salmonis TaxID=72036 RepID=A0A0K2UZR4_LEPSM